MSTKLKIQQFQKQIVTIHEQLQVLLSIRGFNTRKKNEVERKRKLVMAIGCMLNHARNLQSEIDVQGLEKIEQAIMRRLKRSLESLVKEYEQFIVEHPRLFQAKQKQEPKEKEEVVRFEKMREIDYEEEEKEEMLEDVTRIKQIMGDIKEISKDVGHGVQEQGQILEEVQKETEEAMEESKVAGQNLKKGAKYKNSALKWWLGGTLTVVGAAIGTLIPIPGVGTAIGAGAGAALGGSIGAGIEQVKKKKLKEVKFEGSDEIEEKRAQERTL